MSYDLLTKFDRAAAQPSRDVPFSVIERRLHVRRSRRRGGIVLSACAIVAGVITTFAFTGGSGPSVETVHPAAQTVTNGQPPFTIQIPDDWVEGSNYPFTTSAIVVGTTKIELGENIGAACSPLGLLPESSDGVFVRIFETGLVDVLLSPRPADFSLAPPNRIDECAPGGRDLVFDFEDQGRSFEVRLAVGASATAERTAEGFGVLNSLTVEPLESTPAPVTIAPSTVPASAETEAITEAFLGWINTRPVDASGAYIEDFENIREAIIGAAKANGDPDGYTGRVDAITRIEGDEAEVIYSFLYNGQDAVPFQHGRAVRINGVWKVSRDTVCAALEYGPVRCPPRDS